MDESTELVAGYFHAMREAAKCNPEADSAAEKVGRAILIRNRRRKNLEALEENADRDDYDRQHE
jgi:hypothetical protein